MAHLTPVQRQYIRKRTRVVDLDPSELAGELNIIPFLDIVINLIMFLLMTTTVVLAVVQIDTELPEYRRGGVGRAGAAEQTLNLNVTLADEGIIVAGSGGKLAPGCDTTATGRVLTVPKRRLPEIDDYGQPTGRNVVRYDWDALTECVSRVKREYPDERQVTVSADPLVEYQHLVAAMDALRMKGTEQLFPEVLLSGGVR